MTKLDKDGIKLLEKRYGKDGDDHFKVTKERPSFIANRVLDFEKAKRNVKNRYQRLKLLEETQAKVKDLLKASLCDFRAAFIALDGFPEIDQKEVSYTYRHIVPEIVTKTFIEDYDFLVGFRRPSEVDP